MPTQNIQVLAGTVSLEELCQVVARLQKQMRFLQDKNIDSENAREMGGWEVGQTELVSLDGDVGMSTADTGGDDVRLWAGSTSKATAPWKVHKSGKMEATGATIQSSAGYPKITFDPTGNLMAAYLDADNYIAIDPDAVGGNPTFLFYDGGSLKGSLSYVAAVGILLKTFAGSITINSDTDLNLKATSGTVNFGTSTTTYSSWNSLHSSGDGETLATALNNLSSSISSLASAISGKATSGSSTGGAGSHNHGIAPGTVLLTDSGTVTWSAAGNHVHTQT